MCKKCEKIDARIAQFKRLIDPALDPLTLELMKEGLRRAESDKAGIQCDDKPE